MAELSFFGLDLETILPGVVGAAVVSGVAFLLSFFYFEPRRKRRRRAHVLGFPVSDSDFAPALIVGTTEPIKTDIYMRPTVGYGSLLAVAYVAQVVGDVSPDSDRSDKLDVLLAGDDTATRSLSRADEHNVLIGGPTRNSATTSCLRYLNQMVRDGVWTLVPSREFPPSQVGARKQARDGAVTFAEEPSRRVLNVNGFEFAAEMELAEVSGRPTKLSGTDYGLIVRGAAPNDAGRVVLLAGVHTYGSAGAGYFLAELAKVRRPLVPSLKRSQIGQDHYTHALKYLGSKAHKDLVLVVRTKVDQGLLTSSMLVAAWNIVRS